MKKISKFFIIVLLSQVLVIYLIYRAYYREPNTSNSSIVKENSEKNEKTQPAADTVKPDGQKSEIPKKIDTARVLTFPRLDYKNAINGNIVSLPSSKDAKTGILVNVDTGEVLWAKQPKQTVPIASMTKMMTLLLIMEELDKNNPSFSLDTEIQVTNEAYKIGGSQVYLDPKEKFTVKELLKSIVLKSANDSSYLLSQYLGGGDVDAFIVRMNKRAKEIGMQNTSFHNPDGLPEKDPADENVASAEDLVILSQYLLQHPLILEFSTMKKAAFREGTPKEMLLTNTNRLVMQNVPGVNGMKTGYTKKAGFCITVTCNRNGTNLATVVTGFKSAKDRDTFVKQLLNWGYKRIAGMDEKDVSKDVTMSDVKSVSKESVGKKTQIANGTETKTYTVKQGDTLASIAKKFYKKASWKKIYDANRDHLSTPNSLKTGMVLQIPAE